ncbi:hypothetical protein MSAN_02230700 [Mycena sanguinolenta]|uniref:Pre-mRNA polyadenylation factor Fip1 domain-containing protein n=1 Tax=Mycena sanguinolenta TaxID=230812 RepID=A0A8H6XB94_9AGAR|nr:hypothetical protein MSAN_02230700 [Mycena sanguinolenta]
MLLSATARRVPQRPICSSACRSYALSVVPPKVPKGMTLPRHFTGKKEFQYNWYMRILNSSTTSPLLFLYHNDFTSQKLIKLRRDISAASNRSKPSLSSPSPAGVPVEPVPEPLLTVIRSGIFGAALRDFPAVDNADVMRMTEGVKGALAVLSLPVLDPPQLKAILRTFDRNVPPRKPKTEEELKKELEEKNADPINPGRRMKRVRQIVDPELRVLGALLDGQILLPERITAVADMPSLQTLRAQLVGLLSSPGTQLAMTLSEASGGRLARTLEGLKKGLEETAGEVAPCKLQPEWMTKTIFFMAEERQRTSLGSFPTSEQIVAQLEAQAAAAEASTSQVTDVSATVEEDDDDDEEAVDLGSETEDDEDDVEIIMEPQSRSLDFRQSAGRSAPARTTSSAAPLRPQSSLTTEYTPIQRGGAVPPKATPQPPPTPQPQPTPQPVPQAPSDSELPPATPIVPQTTEPPPQSAEATAAPTVVPTDDGVDPSTLPPVTAPPSHPSIDFSATGTLEGRSIIDVDLSSMTDKQWRKPGSDISDWFNYGFDELSWEAYCYRRRDLGELANVLKTNVLNFSGMPEDQLTALPPEVRQMVMTGTTAMMNTAANPAMMGQGMMMDMSNMSMMGPMAMGMNGEMAMNGGMMPMGMQGDGAQGQIGNGAGSGVAEGGAMQEGFVGNAGMMGMGMEYGVAEQQQQQQMYPQMEAPQPTSATGLGRGGAGVVPYRGRGLRGTRGFVGRGRGRGYGSDAPPPPVRPTSPLPPNVPTGPRNQNKYKDRDGNAPAVDGLDYGGTKDGRTPSGEPEERSRKRRSSPGLDDVRGSKRR